MRSDRAGRLSRRQLIAGALAAGGGAVAATAAPAEADPPKDEASLLTTALRFEQLSVLAYEHVLTLPLATGQARGLLTKLLGQERAHARALSAELNALGRPLPPAPTRLQQVNQALSDHGMSGDLTAVKSLKDAVQLLLDVGELCQGAYYTAVGGVTAVGPMVRAVQALGSEGEHATLLSGLIYKDIKKRVPAWYVAGVT